MLGTSRLTKNGIKSRFILNGWRSLLKELARGILVMTCWPLELVDVGAAEKNLVFTLQRKIQSFLWAYIILVMKVICIWMK